MVFGEKKTTKVITETTTNVIELNAEMNGTLSFKEPVDLRINGLFTGKLDVKGSLTVGTKASVEANITSDFVVIAGKVVGNVLAQKLLTLMPTAVLIGDINTPKLNVVEGAIFQGTCQMNNHPEPVSSDSEWFDVNGLASYLEIEEAVILELVRGGKIPFTQEGESYKFERSQIDNWAATGSTR